MCSRNTSVNGMWYKSRQDCCVRIFSRSGVHEIIPSNLGFGRTSNRQTLDSCAVILISAHASNTKARQCFVLQRSPFPSTLWGIGFCGNQVEHCIRLWIKGDPPYDQPNKLQHSPIEQVFERILHGLNAPGYHGSLVILPNATSQGAHSKRLRRCIIPACFCHGCSISQNIS